MTVYGAHTAVRVAVWITKLQTILLRHGLHLEGEYPEVVHDGRHARWNHAEVFGADEHLSGFYQLRQFLHCLTLPEVIVALIEIIIIETIEDATLIVAQQGLIDEGILRRDARMIKLWILMVTNEEHIADEGVETVSDN
jgi:hypothetical protein